VWNFKLVSLQVRIYTLLQNTVLGMYKYRILYHSVPVHTVNNGKVSQDLLLYHVPLQPWTKRLYHEILYCIQPLIMNPTHIYPISHGYPVSYTHLSYLLLISSILHTFILSPIDIPYPTHIYPISHWYPVSYTHLSDLPLISRILHTFILYPIDIPYPTQIYPISHW